LGLPLNWARSGLLVVKVASHCWYKGSCSRNGELDLPGGVVRDRVELDGKRLISTIR
jgi:hypothetical protein